MTRASRGMYLPDTQRKALHDIRRTVDAVARDDQRYSDIPVVADTRDHRRCTFGAAGKSYSCTMLMFKRLAQNGMITLHVGRRPATHEIRLTPQGVRRTTVSVQSEADAGGVAQ